MRHPVWILNSILSMLLLAALLFMAFSQQPTPEWEDLTIGPVKPLHKKVSEINISKIYDYDLFDTYERVQEVEKAPDYVIPLPQPPQPNPVRIPELPRPQFLDPLKIALKGIIIVSSDDTKNRAIIVDTATNNESVHRIGDTIEDAQLIKILSNKVIFLRSNGQQEVLYLRQKDAKNDPSYAIVNGWKDIVQPINDTTYRVNTAEFLRHISSVGQFLDLLEMTTVYDKGTAVGCRIGRITNDSLGAELGLRHADIIESINGVPTTTTQDRMDIYKQITSSKTKDTITVNLVRNNIPMELSYILTDTTPPQESMQKKADQPQAQAVQPTPEQIEQLQERHKFAPTLRDIRAREQENIIKKGKLSRHHLSSAFAQ